MGQLLCRNVGLCRHVVLAVHATNGTVASACGAVQTRSAGGPRHKWDSCCSAGLCRHVVLAVHATNGTIAVSACGAVQTRSVGGPRHKWDRYSCYKMFSLERGCLRL